VPRERGWQVVRPVEGGADRLTGSGAGCRDRRRSSGLGNQPAPDAP
jgi:hypothetical protein